MISRRLIRTKVLQILYAVSRKEDYSINQAEKELFYSIEKAYDLYHLLLLLPYELVKVNEQKIEKNKQKLRPSYEDLHPNMRFCENKVIQQLRFNRYLLKYTEEKKISWANQAEIMKLLFQELQEQDFFVSYMSKAETTYTDDLKVVIEILEKLVPLSSVLEGALEEMSIFWNDDLEYVINMAVKTVKKFKDNGSVDKPLFPMFKNDDDIDFAKTLIRKAILNKDKYNDLIKSHTQNWEFDRIAIMDLLLMQLALTEILEFQSIPVKVSLNEYIELAKYYSTPSSNNFINGILDNIVKELQAQNKIFKTGKGLIET